MSRILQPRGQAGADRHRGGIMGASRRSFNRASCSRRPRHLTPRSGDTVAAWPWQRAPRSARSFSRCGAAEGAAPLSGGVYQSAGFITRDSAQGSFAKYVLSSMLGSLQMNHEWEIRAAQAAGHYANAMMQMSNAVTQSPIRHARQQSAQGSAGGWNHPNTGGVPKITRDPAVEQRREAANRGTRRGLR